MRKPSEETDEYWFYEDINPFFHSTLETGKWFAFIDRSEIDAVWDKAKIALQVRAFGPAIKVSTARENMTQKYEQLANGRTHILIAYTRDYDDDDDRMRVAMNLLEQCGLQGKTLYYKRDMETFSESYGDQYWYTIFDGGVERSNERFAG